MSQRTRQHRMAIRLWAMLISLVLAIAVEFQFHIAEWLVGAYLESGNENRARLERFVQQEIQVAQAREKVKQLVETRTERPTERSRRRTLSFDTRSEVIQLDNGSKLMMSRERFMKIFQQLESLQSSFSAIGAGQDNPELETWSRTILVRPESSKGGELYLVDDQNYVLKKFTVTPHQFNVIGAYGANNAGSTFDKTASRVYTPQRFFAMVRGLSTAVRDQIADGAQVGEWESSATRVGISEPEDGMAQVLIEQIAGGRVTITPISVSVEALHEIDVALGEAVPEDAPAVDQ